MYEFIQKWETNAEHMSLGDSVWTLSDQNTFPRRIREIFTGGINEEKKGASRQVLNQIEE